MRGSVSVYIPDIIKPQNADNNQKDMNSNSFTKEKKTKKNTDKKNGKELEKHEEPSSIISIKEISPSLILDKVVEVKQKKIKVLTAGASFGELALMEKKPRAATIKCDTECHFAVLEKDHFNDILSTYYIVFH